MTTGLLDAMVLVPLTLTFFASVVARLTACLHIRHPQAWAQLTAGHASTVPSIQLV
jgi:hypothetical protein